MADSFSFVSSLAPRAIPWLGRLATLAVIALLAWLGARLFWALTAPATPEPAIAVDTDPSRVAQTIVARHLFGEAPAQGTAGAVASRSADIKLHGVVAPGKRGHTAIAILSSKGRPAVVVRVGDEIVPGVTLQRVLPRSVEIDQGGQVLTLTLPDRGKP